MITARKTGSRRVEVVLSDGRIVDNITTPHDITSVNSCGNEVSVSYSTYGGSSLTESYEWDGSSLCYRGIN